MLISDPVIPAPASEASRTATRAQSSTVFIRLIADGCCIHTRNSSNSIPSCSAAIGPDSFMTSVRIPPGHNAL